MKKTFLLAVTALAALLAVSCQKEEMGRVLTATIEQYEHDGDSKAYINSDFYACWENNDQVQINNTRCTVSITEGNEHNYSATIQGRIPTGQDLLAFYPADQVTNLTATGGTVTLPYIQTYNERNGHQVINNPMAAYCPAGSNELKFRNLCALLKVTVKAPDNEGLQVKTIQVRGDDDQMLWGKAPLKLNYQGLPMLGKMTDGSAFVRLNFDTPVEISAGCSKSFYIVVPAASSFIDFSILVFTGQEKSYKKESALDRSLQRNQIGALTYAPAPADKVYAILYTGNVPGFRSDSFGVAQVLSYDNGVILFDRALTTIGYTAFKNNNLTSIYLPAGVTSIGTSAFNGCSSLSSIILPSSLASIGKYAFEDCNTLSSITLPTGVTSIGEKAFYGCSALNSITLPAGVTSICVHLFCGCSGLTSVTLPENLTTIEDYAFENCSGLSSITLPAGVTSIGKYAFWGCSSLDRVDSHRETPPTLGIDAFYGISSTAKLHVPDECAGNYSASIWGGYFAVDNIVEGFN